MPIVETPDPEWYFHHVLATAPPHGDRIGPARRHQASWTGAAFDLRQRVVGTELEPLVDRALSQGLTLRACHAREEGVPDRVLRSLVRRRLWTVARHGVVCPLPPQPALPIDSRFRRALAVHGRALQVRAAAAASVYAESVVSVHSAAAMHGLPLLSVPDDPSLTTVADHGRSVRSGVRLRCAGFDPAEVTDWFGVAVFDVARTVVDLAREAGLRQGLVAADAALNEGLVTPDALVTARRSARYRPGVRHADRVIALADGRSESPLETLTRLCLVEGAVPPDDLQAWIETSAGRFRVDMLYDAQRVIIECDGELKYADQVEGPNPLVGEKRRQEALERAGYIVVRVTWSDVMHRPADVVARVAWALGGTRRRIA